MSVGIYKIENLITHKVYIGQSRHIEIRWQEHCRPSSDSIISRAIRKYGKENFSFEILEECEIDDLNQREEYYIQQYNSVVPNGYNIEERMNGSRSYFLTYSKDDFEHIVFDIKHSSLSFAEIANKYNLDTSMIYYINRGDYHMLANETYPLRVVQSQRETNYCVDCGKQIHYTSTRCVECDHVRQQRCERPSREELKYLIRTSNFLQIGRICGVSDNAIRKWCEQEGLPYKTTVIKSMTDEEWEMV